MWYSSGTVSATDDSNIITGTGTAFLANVRIGDGITIEGSTSLHEVIGIASNTQLTINPAYTGTTGAGKQYAVAPILGYDKDLSDAFNQLRLQFGDQLSSLQPWAYAATAGAALDALGASVSGKSGAPGTAARVRAGLALGPAVTAEVTTTDTDPTSGRVMKVGDFGIGSDSAIPYPHSSLDNIDGVRSGIYRASGEVGAPNSSIVLHLNYSHDNVIQYAFERSEEHTSELQSRGHLVC